jgi:hypothetical protein
LIEDLAERRRFAQRILNGNLVGLHHPDPDCRVASARMVAFARKELEACVERRQMLEQLAAWN